MPKLNSVPKYRRHRATGQAVVTIAGRDHYLGRYGTKASEVQYDRLIGEWIAAGRPAFGASSSELTIMELCARYWQHAKAYYVPGGLLAMIKRMLRTLKMRYGKTLAGEFGPLALKAVRQQLVDEGLSRTYCNRIVNDIRRMFKWAASEQLISESIWRALQTVDGLRRGHTTAPENEPITPVDDAVVEATVQHLSATVAAMVMLQRLTGMRPDEVCRLRPCEIDRSDDVWTYTPSHHKTAHHGRDRVIHFGPKGQAILRPYLLRDAEAYCFVPAEVAAKLREERHTLRKTPLSCGNVPGSNRCRKPRRKPGSRYDVHSYRRAIHRACDAAFPPPDGTELEEIKKWRSEHRWSPNRLRHTFATEVRKRDGLEAAQALLGHAKADVTQIYAERDLALAQRVAREVG
jgi:integrase